MVDVVAQSRHPSTIPPPKHELPMPRAARALTDRQVATAKVGRHAVGAGLYIDVRSKGSKSWVFRYQLRGGRREMGLGAYPLVGLAEARRLAESAADQVARGIDPLDWRRTEEEKPPVPTAPTVREVAEAFIAAHEGTWKNPKHRQQWRNTLATYVYPVMGEVPVDQVDTKLVLDVVKPLWTVKNETASRVRSRIEAVLDAARVEGHRPGGSENPARWRGHLQHVLPPRNRVRIVEHHSSMPYAMVPTFWPRLQVQDGVAARAIELTVLTAGRTQEVHAARWEEIDLDEWVWTVPAERMKSGHLHRVPLSDPIVALLRRLLTIRDGEFVFPGQERGRPISAAAMYMALGRMEVPYTVHGFRSSFRTWAAEKTTFSPDICEMALAHTEGNPTVAAYQRGDLLEKRRALMCAWATYVTGPSVERGSKYSHSNFKN
jgi:integrase